MNPATTLPGAATRQAILNMAPAEFRSIGHELIDTLADFLEQLPEGTVTKGQGPRQIRKLIGGENSLPFAGTPAIEVLKKATKLVTENSLFNGHPKFLGYITSSPAPIGALGDLVASITNPNCGAFILSPVATEIEMQSVRWLAELINYPTDCGGILVSGGNMANLVAILAARKAMADWNIREEGLGEMGLKFVLYATRQTHTWVYKAADLFGLGLNSIRWIPMTDAHRMNVHELEKQIETDKIAGYIPMAVIGTAGSISFGTVDPLKEIAAVCKKHKIWFHVDGAYGALAGALPELQELFNGMREADSVAVDPHKWLYCPLEAGCTLVRNPKFLLDAFCFHPEYYNFDGTGEENPVNYYEFGPQNSRGFRALKVWLVLQQAGKEGIIKMIQDDISLARQLYEEVKKYKSLQAFTNDLSITTFRFVPEDLSGDSRHEDYLNKLNTEMLIRIQKGGELFISNAVLDGKYILRSCIVNFRTSLNDIKAIPDIVIRYGRETDKEMRGKKQE